ncbi:unnamed protein product [Acanthoscelides obtectus]|uniref:Uncharacterized protein n=1 Tax=Acanthoscelides obtectus TaxID=200917 RepID=A0A9P0QCB2_ACAOB|nr:unnamed protein product [Acanthoscelides obtectus]CAK1665444.1 hypothetical protein AOBTE_LOCUS24818 [Acanthoscelides obtectus]
MSKNWFCNRGLSPITQHPRDEEKDKTSETVITDSRKVSSVVKQNSDHSDCNSVISSTSPKICCTPPSSSISGLSENVHCSNLCKDSEYNVTSNNESIVEDPDHQSESSSFISLTSPNICCTPPSSSVISDAEDEDYSPHTSEEAEDENWTGAMRPRQLTFASVKRECYYTCKS